MARETGNPIRILVVEDEPKVAASLAEGLEAEGYRATVAPTGEDGFFFLKTESFALAILDIMLPGRNGIDILKAARRDGLTAPVLLLTAKDGVEDRVAGLDAGADDYLTKPFAFAELLARVRALTRRGSDQGGAQLEVKDLRIDRSGPGANWGLPPRNSSCWNISRSAAAASSRGKRFRAIFGGSTSALPRWTT
jgi:DNA-binding response OmpR family regulator